MKFFSTNNKNHKLSFKEAVIQGLAPDNGLYFPESIPVLSKEFYQQIEQKTLPEVAFDVLYPFVKEAIPKEDFQVIVADVFNFEIPLVQIEDAIFSLELFHGPTCAFKDVGARFMSRCLGYFSKEKVTVLVATSGDTGSAVANGFYGIEGVDVVLLYPSNKISEIQEMQLTTLGKNITALEVEGVFDDCQDMVKAAFTNEQLNEKMFLTSANSINIARWLPQSIYYHWAYAQLENKAKETLICVPSGNFGNLTAGVLAYKMGLPIHGFIAATNNNDIVPQYLQNGVFTPKKSVQTLANAMDVGNPSNFVRLLELFHNDYDAITKNIQGSSKTDGQIKDTIKMCKENTKYILDPHGAVGYQALKDLKQDHQQGIFLETAHPAKFGEVVEECIQEKITIPERLAACMTKEKKSVVIKNQPKDLADFLTQNFITKMNKKTS